ncbi:MAG TPA: hypothetical protein DCR44_04050 [Acholeplasmatales bacterium]|nr:hypothetical protein [Acholeplasmatales bacterium]
MKNLRNKIVLSGLVLLFALVATIGSTFAWFTVSNTVSVPSLTLNVQSSESLLIRVFNGETGDSDNEGTEHLLDAETYKANLALSDFTAATTAGYNNLSSWRLSPVTMTTTQASGLLNGKTPNKMDIDSKVYSALDVDTSTVEVNHASGFVIDLKLWVLSQGSGTGDIVLQDLAITASNAISAQDEVVNAVRLAVWNSLEYSATPTDPAESAKIFGLDNDYAFAFLSGQRGYDGDATDSIVALTQDALELLHSEWYDFDAVGDLANVYQNDKADADVITTLSQNIPTLMVVRVYIEGWDLQTTNAVLAAVFSISFKFTLQDAA